MRQIPRKLLSLYRKTYFFVRNLEGKLVRFSARAAHRFPFLKKKKFAVITAWNPGGKIQSAALNRKQNARLKRELKKAGYPFYETRGYWRKHSEESFTVEGISRKKAVMLGKKYRQYSILYNDAKGVRFIRV